MNTKLSKQLNELGLIYNKCSDNYAKKKGCKHTVSHDYGGTITHFKTLKEVKEYVDLVKFIRSFVNEELEK